MSGAAYHGWVVLSLGTAGMGNADVEGIIDRVSDGSRESMTVFVDLEGIRQLSEDLLSTAARRPMMSRCARPSRSCMRSPAACAPTPTARSMGQ